MGDPFDFGNILRPRPTPLPDYAQSVKFGITLRDLMDQRRIREQQYQLQQQQMQEHVRKAQYEQQDRDRAETLRSLFAKNPNLTFQDIAAVDPAAAFKFETDRRQMQTAQLAQQTAQRKAQTEQQQQVADVLYGVRNVQGEGRQAAMDQAVMEDLMRPEAQRLGLGQIGQETPLAPTEQQWQQKYAAAYTPEKLQTLLKGETEAKTQDLKQDDERFKAAYPLLAGANDQEAWTAAIRALPIHQQPLIPPRFSTANKQKALAMWVPPGEAARMGSLDSPDKVIQALNQPGLAQDERDRLTAQLGQMVKYRQDVRPVTIQDTTGLVATVMQNPKLWKSLPGEVKAKIAPSLSAAGFTEFGEEKLPTQGEELLAGYAARVKQANKGFEKVTMGTGERAWNNLTPTWMNTDAGQVFAQDERNFINSILRRESGAVISPSEFAEARAQYIPQPRDSDAVLERKRQNRLIVQQNLIRSSGKAYQDPDELLKEAGAQKSASPAGVPASAIPSPLLDTKKPTHRFNPTTGEMKTVTR